MFNYRSRVSTLARGRKPVRPVRSMAGVHRRKGFDAMDQTRYVLGVMLIVGLPPAIVFWLIIHPVVAFWRRLGPGWTYWVVGTACSLLALGIFLVRGRLMGPDYGTNWLLISVGVLLYCLSAWLSVLTKRTLKMSTFAGLPEVARGGGGKLLEDGVYGVIRHPRYLSVIIGTAGFALFVNFLGAYLAVLASVPVLVLVIYLEERELADRFGQAYLEYRERVPALIPGIGASLPRETGQEEMP